MLTLAAAGTTHFKAQQRRPGLARSSKLNVMANVVLNGKTCVVTGASQGIGLEFANQLLEKGNTVIAAVRSPSTAKGLQQLSQKAPAGKLHITTLDAGDSESIKQWAADLRSNCPGVHHVDVLINNAGVYGRSIDIDSVTADDMLFAFTTNTIGPLITVQQLLKQGLLGGAGRPSLVANVTSKVGSVDDNRGGGGYAYRASKAALNIVNKSMSIDLAGRGITAVLLHPGYVRTRMTGGQGLIDVQTSVSGMLSVLESNAPLSGHWYDYKAEEIPW